MSFLELTALEKTFPDGTRAVKGIDLAIEEGELVVLLGPSGCGKTTTLRMIAGLETATAGTIRMGGRDVTKLRPSQRDVGFVFQFYALYPHMSVAANIAFPLKCAGMPQAEQRRVIQNVVARLGLQDLLDERPHELSGGDQQRVALARAMVRRPIVWLMDEPLGTLDADRRMEMCEFLRARQLEERVTTVYVTHDQAEAMRLADRIVVMSAGEILQAGPPIEVYDEPASLFVANFVGSPGMNLVPGEVRGGAFRPRMSEASIPLAGAAPEGPATLGVRPEFVRNDPDGPISGEVVVDEYLGADRCLHLRTGFGRLVLRGGPDEVDQVGRSLSVSFDPAHVRLFDPESGERTA
ncbi:MAG: ABC transporter ATP-binding protein [Planctomycetota bacterium]|nr:ABC transporter ATP-binding protein [Planctomycetota bacterium]